MHTRKIESEFYRVPMKDKAAVELTEQEAEFCRKHDFWPGRMEMTVYQASQQDQIMARRIAAKCDCRLKFKT